MLHERGEALTGELLEQQQQQHATASGSSARPLAGSLLVLGDRVRTQSLAVGGVCIDEAHLQLTAEGYHGYWSSGGVNGWADDDEVRV